MPKYERIKAELLEDLEEITPVLDIIDDLHKTGRAASIEESEQINDLSVMHSSEVIALMLESKAQKRNAKLLAVDNREYDPFLLVTSQEIEDFKKYLSGLPEGQEFHYDIILRAGDVHSTALQLHSDGGIARSFFIDSLADINKEERNNLEEALGGDSHNYVKGKLLNSDTGCSIFSIQHLNTMNRFLNESNHSAYLERGDNRLEDLDPMFLKHIQSMTASDKYETCHKGQDLFVDKRHSKTFRKHLSDFTASVAVVDKEQNVELKQRNYSILYKTEKYLRESLRTLEEIHGQENGDQKLEEVLSHRSGKHILNSVYKQMELTPAQIEQVQGLYNQDQINLALHYRIPREDLETAKCFSSKEMSKTAFKYINESGLNHQEAFNRVKDFSNSYQLYSSIQFGLSFEEVAKSQFLSSKVLSSGTFEYLQEWYEKAGEKGAAAAFETIKMFESYKPQESRALDTVSNLCGKDANEFLSFCIGGQSSPLIKAWLAAGADVNKVTNGVTPLMKAIGTDNPKIIDQIVMAGARIPSLMDRNNKKHFTPEKLTIYLKTAIDSENIKVIRNLIKYSPNVLKEGINGVSPLEYAVQSNKMKLLNELLPEVKSVEHSPSKMGIENLDINSPNTTPTKKQKTEKSYNSKPGGRRLIF